MFAPKLPTVSASAAEAPPWSTPMICRVVSSTGMVARRKSGPTSMKRMFEVIHERLRAAMDDVLELDVGKPDTHEAASVPASARRWPHLASSGKLTAMKLYTYYRSTAAFRVRIALNIKGLAYESVSRHLRKGEHRTAEFFELNPQGLVPALDDGGRIYSQSLAIIEYLNEKYPRAATAARGCWRSGSGAFTRAGRGV